MIETDLKILRQKSKTFAGSQKDLQAIIIYLESHLNAPGINGVGLSTIQIGIPIKIAIIRTSTLSLDLYNTEILQMGGMMEPTEGCLSLPNTYRKMLRARTITIRNGDGKIYHLEGFDAVVVQHEMDHWEGRLIIDKINFSPERGDI